jgi:hypothetical protein
LTRQGLQQAVHQSAKDLEYFLTTFIEEYNKCCGPFEWTKGPEKLGDTLIVWKLDRLGRSLRDLISMLDDLKQRGIKFRSLTEAIDTATPTGRAMWQMIGLLTDARSRDQLKKGLLAGFHAGIT